jgi:hypothetical protein
VYIECLYDTFDWTKVRQLSVMPKRFSFLSWKCTCARNGSTLFEKRKFQAFSVGALTEQSRALLRLRQRLNVCTLEWL